MRAFFVVLLLAHASAASAHQEKTSEVPTHAAHSEVRISNLNAAPFPILLYTPETRLGFGAGIVFTERDGNGSHEEKPNTMTMLFVYTQNNQYALQLAPELYPNNESWKFDMEFNFYKYPETVYGVGHNTPESAAEDLTTKVGEFIGLIEKRIYLKMGVGLMFEHRRVEVLKVEEGGIFDTGAVAGADGGRQTGLGLAVEWDTRNNLFYPRFGGFYRAFALYFREWMGSEFEFDDVGFDFRRYIPVGYDRVIGVQTYGQFKSGDVPYDRLPTLGDDLIRGIIEGRYQDKCILVAQGEYRFPLKRPGWYGAGFASVGDVAEDPTAFNGVKFAVGGGLRYAINVEEDVNLRVDVGGGPWGTALYLQLLEAF